MGPAPKDSSRSLKIPLDNLANASYICFAAALQV